MLVDDRRAPVGPLLREEPPEPLRPCLHVIQGLARGPAAARNAGWRVASAEWVVFLDDDVVPSREWLSELAADLAGASPRIAGVQGKLTVPLARDRPPTDWERNVHSLEKAVWATAEMAYRRRVLEAVGGFDERFPRAYREDCDLALRVTTAGWELTRGRRRTLHPVRAADPFVSVRLQAGNADDVLMRALHGAGWRERGGVPLGRRRFHLATTIAGVLGVLLAATGPRSAAALSAACWLAGTAEFAWRRIEPGPRTREEVFAMVVTSLAVPPVCTWQWLKGAWRWGPLLLRNELR